MSELTPCQTPDCTSRINVAVMGRNLCGLCWRDLPRSAKGRMTATTLARHHHHNERKKMTTMTNEQVAAAMLRGEMTAAEVVTMFQAEADAAVNHGSPAPTAPIVAETGLSPAQLTAVRRAEALELRDQQHTRKVQLGRLLLEEQGFTPDDLDQLSHEEILAESHITEGVRDWRADGNDRQKNLDAMRASDPIEGGEAA